MASPSLTSQPLGSGVTPPIRSRPGRMARHQCHPTSPRRRRSSGSVDSEASRISFEPFPEPPSRAQLSLVPGPTVPLPHTLPQSQSQSNLPNPNPSTSPPPSYHHAPNPIPAPHNLSIHQSRAPRNLRSPFPLIPPAAWTCLPTKWISAELGNSGAIFFSVREKSSGLSSGRGAVSKNNF